MLTDFAAWGAWNSVEGRWLLNRGPGRSRNVRM